MRGAKRGKNKTHTHFADRCFPSSTVCQSFRVPKAENPVPQHQEPMHYILCCCIAYHDYDMQEAHVCELCFLLESQSRKFAVSCLETRLSLFPSYPSIRSERLIHLTVLSFRVILPLHLFNAFLDCKANLLFDSSCWRRE